MLESAGEIMPYRVFIPKAYGSSLALTGAVETALYGFLAFYVSCLAITWAVYTRRGGLLWDVERGATPAERPATLLPAG